MDVWIDITNAPHVPFFKVLIEKLEKRSIDYSVTSRKHKFIAELLELYDIDYVEFGRYGKTLYEKLYESTKRIEELAKYVHRLKPDIGVAKHSVELPRVCFGFKIKSIFVLDNEYAEAQNKLTLPIVDTVVVPECLKLKLNHAELIKFKGVCEVANVKAKAEDDFEVEKPEKTVLVRPPPRYASYLDKKDDTKIIVRKLLDMGLNVIYIARDNERIDGAVTPDRVFSSVNLLSKIRVMIGGGGTMNRESALLGTPTVSFYPGKKLAVDRYLIKLGLIESADVDKVIENLPKYIKRGRKKIDLKAFEDPTDKILEKILEISRC